MPVCYNARRLVWNIPCFHLSKYKSLVRSIQRAASRKRLIHHKIFGSSEGKVPPCICMSVWAEQALTYNGLMWWRRVTLPPTCTPPLLVTHEYGSNWIHWRQTSVNWEDNDDCSQLFRSQPSKGWRPPTHHRPVLPSRRGSVGGRGEVGEGALQSFVLPFFGRKQ